MPEEGRVCSEGLAVLRPVPSIVHVYSSNGETLCVSEVLTALVISMCSKCLYSQVISRGSQLEIWGEQLSLHWLCEMSVNSL